MLKKNNALLVGDSTQHNYFEDTFQVTFRRAQGFNIVFNKKPYVMPSVEQDILNTFIAMIELKDKDASFVVESKLVSKVKTIANLLGVSVLILCDHDLTRNYETPSGKQMTTYMFRVWLQ